MQLCMIVAVGKNGQIGKDNKLLWHIPEDLKMFKELTSGHHIIMGRKTFESIGKPLPNRTSVVLSRNNFKQDGIFTCENIEDAIELCKKRGESKAFIIGGAKLYASTLEKIDILYLTNVDYDGDADTYFPKLNTLEWIVLQEKSNKETITKEGVKIPAWRSLTLMNRKKIN